MKKAIAMVGAGMAGLSCARALQTAGYNVRMFEKGYRASGRMATRLISTPNGDASFDIGAQYFSVRHPLFAGRVAQWRAMGLVAPWLPAGPDAFVGTPTMCAPLEQMASDLDVRWNVRVEALKRVGGRWGLEAGDQDLGTFNTVLLAVPAEQAAPLLAPWDEEMASIAKLTHSLPCWTVMLVFAERLVLESDTLPRGEPIGWAARNSSKFGRSGPESWIVQASPDWSAKHAQFQPEQVIAELFAAFAKQGNFSPPAPLVAQAHFWRYARSGNAGRSALWSPDRQIGVCGDWLLGPRVESAWLSGTSLAAGIIGR